MKNGKSDSFIKGTLSLSLAVILTKILGVLFKVPLSYVLGDSGMGFFNTAYVIYGFFYILCTAGVPKSITLVLSEERALVGNSDSDYEVLRRGLSLFFKIGLFVSLLNIILAPALARLVGNTKACLSIIAVSPSILFVSLSGVLRGYLNSKERLSQIAVSQLIESIIKLVFGLLLAFIGVKARADLYVISSLCIFGITLGSFVSFLYMFVKAKNEKQKNNKEQKHKICSVNISGKIIKNAFPIALGASLLNLSSALDLMIIIKRLTESGISESYANSLYGNYTTLAVPMFNLVVSVLAPVATAYMPKLSQSSIIKNREDFLRQANQLLFITIIVSVPASLSFYFYSFDLLDVLFTPQSSAIGAEMLIILSIGLSLFTVLTVVNTVLESSGRVIITVVSLLAGSAVKLVSSYLLIGNTSVGIIGAPLGTVISYFVSLIISLAALETRGAKLHAILKLFGMTLIGIIAFYPPYKLIYSVNLFDVSFISMAFSIAVSCIAYISVIFIVHLLATKGTVFKMHKNKYCALDE